MSSSQSDNKPVVVVTGCSDGGIGSSLVIEFLKRKCTVYATARKLSSMKECKKAGARLLELDITVASSIKSAVAKIIAEAGRIDYLVNNAGCGKYAPIIDLDEESMKKTFETNVFAQVAMIKAVAPHMIARRSGKIVNVGSISGIVTTPFSGCYCATKAAFHCISDALRMELKPFGVDVMVVAPGKVGTNIASNASGDKELPQDSVYLPVKDGLEKRVTSTQEGCMPAPKFAKSTVTAILNSRQAYFYEGPLSFLLPFIKRWLPLWLVDWILSRQFQLTRLRKLLAEKQQ